MSGLRMQEWAGSGLTATHERNSRIRTTIRCTSWGDRQIASYFGVSINTVKSLRAVIETQQARRRTKPHLKPFRQAGIHKGGVDETPDRSAENNSRLLFDRIWSVYERVAIDRRLNGPWEAAVLMGMAA